MNDHYTKLPDEIPTSFTNLDGETVSITDFDRDRIAWLRDRYLYTMTCPLKGSMGWTGLAIHMKMVHMPGIAAFLKKDIDGNVDESFAYVLLANGTITSGCFTRHANGTFSLA